MTHDCAGDGLYIAGCRRLNPKPKPELYRGYKLSTQDKTLSSEKACTGCHDARTTGLFLSKPAVKFHDKIIAGKKWTIPGHRS